MEAAVWIVETTTGWWVLDAAQRRFAPVALGAVWEPVDDDGFVLPFPPGGGVLTGGPVVVHLAGGDRADLGDFRAVVVNQRRFVVGDHVMREETSA